MTLYLTEYKKLDGSTWASEAIQAKSFAEAIALAPEGVTVLGELVYSENVDEKIVAVCVEREKRDLIQSMQDDLDGIYPLPKLKCEVITHHLIPRKISYDEFKQDILVPILFTVCFFTTFLVLL